MPPADEENEKATPATPRRASAVKRPGNATPVRKKTSPAVGRTPNSAPAKTKKGEPTLLGDFLLGRPSPHRTGRPSAVIAAARAAGVKVPGSPAGAPARRRRSLDAVKRELKLEEQAVGKIQQPGGVKDRVKQWQKASAAAVVVDDVPTESEEVAEGVDDESVDEEDRLRMKMREGKRPGRWKDREEEDERGKNADEEKEACKSAPKKRVISDGHWVKKKHSPPRYGGVIPKNFLQATAVNPPLNKKIEDWVKRTASDEIVVEIEEEDKQRSRRGSKWEDSDTLKSRKEQATPTKTPRSTNVSKHDDGIRIRPSPDPPFDDGIRILPSKETSPALDNDGMRVKPIRKQESSRKPKEHHSEEVRPPWKLSEKRLRPPDTESRGDANDRETNPDDSSLATPSQSQQFKRRDRKSASSESMDEIPFGNSAFSILELPVGAEAGTLRKPPPKRGNSFAVPKVLKKIYNEGMNIARDTVEPPRVGINQPPSIESWLKGTTDPFIDRPSSVPFTLEVPVSSPRRQSYKEDDQTELELTAGNDDRVGGVKKKRRPRKSEETEDSHDTRDREASPLEITKARDTLPSMENSPPLSPTGLKRTPATRNTSSPKSTRRVPFKDVFLDAFRGESAPVRPKTFSNPLVEISGQNRNPPEVSPPAEISVSDDAPAKRSPRVPSLDLPKPQEKPLPAYPRRQAPTTGHHRLSTIASVETLSTLSYTGTSSSCTGTSSVLSDTTITQDTVLTGPTSSSLSRKSRGSGKAPELKRRLTKHSDLVSMLSLPDNAAPDRTKSIRSARSVRTARTHLETATVQDLMRELADDETKYTRELKTLVDGVIPVLLTSVLQRSDSAHAAGLFSDSADSADPSFTKPIVDMGIALERLKSLHKRAPLQDPHAFLAWAQTAHKTYQDYLASWRMGFQDVVVNLAPNSRKSSMEQASSIDTMPHDANGDILNANGERADVAYLLKRPLVRCKYLGKVVKGLDKLCHSEMSQKVTVLFEELEVQSRRRINQECARLKDVDAYSSDLSRARDLKSMALAEGVTTDPSRQVAAADFFSFDLQHSSGQRLECRVEFILRDKPSDQSDSGDLLIRSTEATHQWLLFPPLSVDMVSARCGDHPCQMIVMARGILGAQEWRECFVVETDDNETITDWIGMLGTSPVPPELVQKTSQALQLPAVSSSFEPGNGDVEIPIGERRQRNAEESVTPRKERRQTSAHVRIAATLPSVIAEESTISIVSPKDLNEAMDTAGLMKRAKPARYHIRTQSQPSSPLSRSPLALDDNAVVATAAEVDSPSVASTDLPFISKIRNNSAPSTPVSSGPLKESMRLAADELKQASAPILDSHRDEKPPPPPAHRNPTQKNALRKIPIIETPTPRGKNRRSSSPLKHEYQPSNASETSSSSDFSESESDGSYSDSSDEELEAVELPPIQPGVSISGRRLSPRGSICSLQNSTLAPSQSASQAPYQVGALQKPTNVSKRMTAMILSWSDKKGRWEDLWAEPCSLVITPGRIEAFEMSAAHSLPRPNSGNSDLSRGSDPNPERPLISLELTPVVYLRQSTALDIEIKSPPRPESRLTCSGTVLYRSINVIDCLELYAAVHRSRMENPKYKKLEEERLLNSYGDHNHAYEAAIKGNRRRSWLGRKRSYRVSARAPSVAAESEQSAGSNSSAFSALRRLSRGSFNIGKSSIENSQARSGMISGPQSLYSSSSSGITPPRTPTSPSLAGTATTQGHLTTIGSENLKVRLYVLATTSKWEDQGAARLTITAPPRGMRQASALYNGLEKRVLVTRKPLTSFSSAQSPDLDAMSMDRASRKEQKEKDSPNVVLLDVVLGANCFSRIGNNGIACNVWEDVVGDNGVVGTIGAFGGVSGRTRKWLFDTGNKRDADWIFNLLAAAR